MNNLNTTYDEAVQAASILRDQPAMETLLSFLFGSWKLSLTKNIETNTKLFPGINALENKIQALLRTTK